MVLSLHSEMCEPTYPIDYWPLICLLLQILFVSGLTLIIGPQKTFYFFARKQKIRGTACFIGGILLVFFKRPFIGMVVETFGFLNLFGYGVNWCTISLGLSNVYGLCRDFFPVVITFLRQLPFVGTFLSLPYVRVVGSSSTGSFKCSYTISGGGSTCWITNICSMTILSCNVLTESPAIDGLG